MSRERKSLISICATLKKAIVARKPSTRQPSSPITKMALLKVCSYAAPSKRANYPGRRSAIDKTSKPTRAPAFLSGL